mmetsp:Transcript_12524/g.30833  ORF Transcript_12524/g.30833 Transcript_12524/m.30833 type:complete len:88 (+) Transcript_12524:1250-1513(+)
MSSPRALGGAVAALEILASQRDTTGMPRWTLTSGRFADWGEGGAEGENSESEGAKGVFGIVGMMAVDARGVGGRGLAFPEDSEVVCG